MASVRASAQAWREVLRTSTALLHEFEASGDFGDLSAREYDVLRALAEGPVEGYRLGVLADETYLPQPSMSRLVERLERRGLVRRGSSVSDGRAVVVTLSDQGRARQQEIGRRHVRSIHRAMSADLSEAELRTLRSLLARVREADPLRER